MVRLIRREASALFWSADTHWCKPEFASHTEGRRFDLSRQLEALFEGCCAVPKRRTRRLVCRTARRFGLQLSGCPDARRHIGIRSAGGLVLRLDGDGSPGWAGHGPCPLPLLPSAAVADGDVARAGRPARWRQSRQSGGNDRGQMLPSSLWIPPTAQPGGPRLRRPPRALGCLWRQRHDVPAPGKEAFVMPGENGGAGRSPTSGPTPQSASPPARVGVGAAAFLPGFPGAMDRAVRLQCGHLDADRRRAVAAD